MIAATERLPTHLKKYVVKQNYERYTPEDQAVWRFIMRQLKDYLSVHAHSSYVEGLEKTGISVESIPRIEEIDARLQKFGWGAVPVSGFIPPAAFMEFQALGILPIASDMRTQDHLLYTPAPDIVHEAAGHAPILIHPEFAAYLRKYADVARNAIISKEDLDQYEAIRVLSDVKEDPTSSKEDIQKAEQELDRVNKSVRYVSEAGLLSRMNWWTAEYGLIGDLKSPKIFGAGLLSSLGESRECLSAKVKKIPLSVHCVEFTYDITEPQPQLFVTPDFQTLHKVLEELAQRMSFRRGGIHGLEQAVLSRAVNTIQLDSGIQISGQLESFLPNGIFLKFSGPCQISYQRTEISGQGVARHAQGYSTPVGLLETDLKKLDLAKGKKTSLKYQSGITVEGVLSDWLFQDDKLILLTFKDCRVQHGSKLLFDPAWGEYDLAVGNEIISVFGGPADRSQFGETDDFVAKRVPTRKISEQEKQTFAFYEKTRALRQQNTLSNSDRTELLQLIKDYVAKSSGNWLKGIELLELAHKFSLPEDERQNLIGRLGKFKEPRLQQNIQDGIRLSQT